MTRSGVKRLLAPQPGDDSIYLFGGYRLPDIDLSTPGVILLTLESLSDNDLLKVRLTERDETAGAFCRTKSFNVVYLRGTKGKTITPEKISAAMKDLCKRISKNDDGTMRLGRFTPPVSGPSRLKSSSKPESSLLSILLPACLFMLLFVMLTRGRGYSLLKMVEAFVEKHPLPFLGAIIITTAVILASSLDAPFDADYMTQRVFFGSLELRRILTHDYPDSRHPPLFYLVLSRFHMFGHEERIMRLPAALFGLASVAMLFFFLKPCFGGLRSLTATTLTAFSVPFLRHAGDVSDITLFTFLCLASSHVFFLLMKSEPENEALNPVLPQRQKGFIGMVRTTADRIFPRYNKSSFRLSVLWIILETAMLYSYYLAPGVVAAHLLTALIYRRKPGGKAILQTFPFIALLSAPVLWSGFKAVTADLVTRTAASEFPIHIWGEKTPWRLWETWIELLAPSAAAAVVVFLLAGAGVIRWMSKKEFRARALFTTLLTTGGMISLGIGVLYLRLNAYYLVFLIPFFGALVTAGSMGLWARSKTGSENRGLRNGLLLHHAFLIALGGAMIFYVALAQGSLLYSNLSEKTLFRRGDAFVQAGELMKSSLSSKSDHKPRMIVTDPDCLHTILLYYAFPDPVKAYRTCRFTSSMPVYCFHRGRELVALTAMGSMTRGWEKTAIKRFLSVFRSSESFLYVRTDRFPNPELTRIVERKCKKEGTWPPLTVYLCKTP